jgi:uncharacterized protein (TIRG00374 family)
LDKNPRRRLFLSYLRIIVAILVICAGIFLFIKQTKLTWPEFIHLLKSLSISTFLAALLLFNLSTIAIGVRWYVLLRVQSIPISLITAVKLTYIGVFYNNFLISSVGGDALRAWYASRHTDKRIEAAFSVVADRVVGVAGLIIMAVIAYSYVPQIEQLNSQSISRHTGIVNYGILCMLSLTVVILILLIVGRIRSAILQVARFLWHLLIRLAQTGYKASLIYLKKPLWGIAVLVLTFVAQTVFIVGCFLLGKELGISLEFKYYLIFLPISWLAAALPISIGGAGILENTLVGLFGYMGIATGPVGVLALCQRLIILLGSLPGAFIHIAGGHVPKPEFSIDCAADIH